MSSNDKLAVAEFLAWVEIDNAPVMLYEVVPEIDVTEDEKVIAVVNCWIASEAGKTFSVHWIDLEVKTPTSGVVFVDGQRCNGKVIRGKDNNHAVKAGVRTSKTEIKPFQFAKLQLTDDENLLLLNSNADIGKIKLELTRTTITAFAAKPWDGKKDAPEVSGVMHEMKAKKAAVHQVSFAEGIEKTAKYKKRIRHDPVPGPPEVTFIFKYCPLSVLQANKIAKRLSSPLGSKNKRKRSQPANTSSTAEVIELTDSESERENATVVKLELQPSTGAKRRKRDAPTEIIDLTI